MERLRKTFKLFLILQIIILGMVSLSAQENVVIISPNGGEIWNAGTIQDIIWETDKQNGLVQIDYSINNGLDWIIITSSTENDGNYEWEIPDNISSECLIRINLINLQNCETRGTWVWASDINTESERAEVFQKIHDAKLNTIFISIPVFNGNWGHGDQSTFLNFIMTAKSKGLSVHAWFLNQFRLVRSGITYVEFRNSSEQEAQSQWVQDIMSAYGLYLDGIHLDYIRYPEFEDINVDGEMDGVRATVKKIHDDLKTNYPNIILSAAVFTLKANRFDRKDSGDIWFEQVPEWFRNWCENNPDTMYTNNNYYYMGPHHMQVQQDPVGWLKDGIMDAIMPMHYAMNDDYWNNEIDYWNSFNSFVGNDLKTVNIGLAWKRGKYDAPGVVKKIKYARSKGIGGFVIFKLFNEDMDDIEDKTLIDALTIDSIDNDFDAPLKETVPTCIGSSSSSGKIFDISDSAFSIIENGNNINSLTIISPDGGEKLKADSSFNIQWGSKEFSGNIKLEISTNKGSTWSSIKDSTTNDGRYSWKVPEINSTNCLLKITSIGDSTITDTSNTYFSIKTETPPTLPLKLWNFAVVATNSIYMKTGVKIFTGNIGVLYKSSKSLGSIGGDEEELNLSTNVKAYNGVTIYANRVKIKSRSSVDNVYCNNIKNYGTIRGEVNKPLTLPLDIQLPHFPTTRTNNKNIKISDYKTEYLSSGTYGNIVLGKKSILILKGGIYYFKNIEIGDYSQILFTSSTKLIIEKRLSTGKNPILGPEPGVNISAKNIIIYVKGKNGKNGQITEIPKAVTIGIRHSLKANIFAPNGTIWFKARGSSEGAFIGKDVMVDFYVKFNLKSAF